jgi:hypothetical protein
MPYSCFADILSDTYVKECIDNLAKYNIVVDSNKWTKDDFISRRDSFDMVFFTKNQDRDYLTYTNTDETQFQLAFLAGNVSREFEFFDIKKESDDYGFIVGLFLNNFIDGIYDNGNYYAKFDEKMTYEEALTVISRIFQNAAWDKAWFVGTYTSEHTYFNFAEDVNLINSKNPVDKYCPQIDISMLNEKITAYEFMVLLHRALYLPVIQVGYAPRQASYLIDNFQR